MCPGSGGGGNKRSRQENGDDAGVKEEDVSDLRAFLKEEEAEIRAESRTLLNRELIARIESCKSLCDKANEHQSFPEALSSGLVAAVRQELSSCFRLGVRLESFINTYQPPRAPHPGKCSWSPCARDLTCWCVLGAGRAARYGASRGQPGPA